MVTPSIDGLEPLTVEKRRVKNFRGARNGKKVYKKKLIIAT